MIEPGKWYVFKSQTDKMVFLQTLMHDYEDTLQEEPNVAFLMGKQALRITPHGHHIGYRTTVDSRYMSPIIFFPEVVSMNNNACGCVSPKGPNDCCAKQPAAVSLVDKYVEEDKRQIIEKHNATAKSILANDPIFKAFAELEAIIKAVNRNNTVRVTFFEAVSKDMLASETQKKLADLDTKTKTKLDALDDKAYECKVLLETATDPNTIGGVLSQYGFLRYDEKED